MKEYTWKMASFAKKVDPDAAIEEIQKVENLHGKITAETVLMVAADEQSVLHGLFEWDNSRAAEQYRLSQARTLINNIEVKIISDGEPVTIPVFEIVRTEEGNQYKHIETLTIDEIQLVRENTIRSINSLKSKLSVYKQFSKVVNLLNAAIEELA